MAALASAGGKWQRALIDYRFEDLEGGRNALKAMRLARRRVRAGHDEYFGQTAEALAPGLYFQPFADHLECYLVKEPQNGTVVLVAALAREPGRAHAYCCKCRCRLGQVGRSDRDQSSLTIGRVGGVGQCRQHPGVALYLLAHKLGVQRLHAGIHVSPQSRRPGSQRSERPRSSLRPTCREQPRPIR